MTITETAQKRIKDILKEKEYLRIKIAGGGCSGYRIGLEKEQKKETDAVLDWKEDSFQPEFKFDIPNTFSCGCGSSFQFK